MCGHAGVAGRINQAEERAFRELLILDSIRGEHSTGIAAVSHHGVDITKVVGDPFELFRTKGWEQTMKRINRVLIGHNRYATQGAVNKKNAHPFNVGAITGAHNGTLTNKYQLHEGYQFEVDSEAMLNHIEQKGLSSALSTARGAWALVWWDDRDDTLNFIRNGERTLYAATVVGADVVFWASEKWMLEVALQRNNIKVDTIEMFVQDMHYELAIGTDRKFTKPVITDMSKCKAPEAPTSHGWYPGATTPPPAVQKPVVEAVKSLPAPSVAQLNRKNVRFFGMTVDKDKNGGEYLDCYEEDHTTISFRLYKNSFVEITDVVGEYFTADIAAMSTADGLYYKLSGSSFKAETAVAPQNVVYYRDGKNKLLTKDEWEAKYEQCSYCGSSLSAGDPVTFTTCGDVLCDHCVKNPEVLSCVNI
jgi:asparagine synthetase B (glutamine-hydrolysing)